MSRVFASSVNFLTTKGLMMHGGMNSQSIGDCARSIDPEVMDHLKMRRSLHALSL